MSEIARNQNLLQFSSANCYLSRQTSSFQYFTLFIKELASQKANLQVKLCSMQKGYSWRRENMLGRQLRLENHNLDF